MQYAVCETCLGDILRGGPLTLSQNRDGAVSGDYLEADRYMVVY